MNEEELRSAFRRHVAQTSDAPMGVVVERARGANLITPEGHEYLDLLAGIGVAALGHGHPRVLAALAAQAERHLHVMVYGELVQDSQVRLAERLAELLPDGLDATYFTNSGAEAIEGAIKLVRKATGRKKLVAFRGGFHGDTTGAVSLGGNPVYRDPFLPLLEDVVFVDFNDRPGLAAIDSTVAGVFVEPVQGEAGVVLPHDGFLPALRRRCDEHGALLVFDEVVTGMGRTGTLFALEWTRTTPDVLVLAKALGGGLPLGAFVASPVLLRTLAEDPPLGHVTTFGGHPLSCATGLAALDTIVDDGLAARAAELGGFFCSCLRARLASDAIADVRNAGLLVGLEFAQAETAAGFVRECMVEHLILGWTLHDDRVVRMAPPLVVSEAELDDATLRMERALVRVRGGGLPG